MFDELVEIICNYVDVQPADVHEESRFMEIPLMWRLSRQRLQKSAQYRKQSIILRH